VDARKRNMSTISASSSAATPTTAPVPPAPKDFRGKSGKKICCACPSTKQQRDLCVVERGEESCQDIIEKHKACLREDGFDVV